MSFVLAYLMSFVILFLLFVITFLSIIIRKLVVSNKILLQISTYLIESHIRNLKYKTDFYEIFSDFKKR